MLPKKYRLTARGDFLGVFRGNLRARSGPFMLMCRNNDLPYAKFGFVVSLAVSKKAVVRNKLRRQLHEIIRSLFSSLAPGYDCVIRAYPGAAELKFGEIEKYIQETMRNVKILARSL